jgi:hypothetical protein
MQQSQKEKLKKALSNGIRKMTLKNLLNEALNGEDVQ